MMDAGHKTSVGRTRERRRELRRPCRVGVAIMPVSAQEGFASARVLDFSEHGLALSVDAPLGVGEQFVVKAPGRARAALLIYDVRSCAPDGAGFRIGAAFAGAIAAPGEEDEQVLRRAFVLRLVDAAAAANSAA